LYIGSLTTVWCCDAKKLTTKAIGINNHQNDSNMIYDKLKGKNGLLLLAHADTLFTSAVTCKKAVRLYTG